jgi:hypothetical protein
MAAAKMLNPLSESGKPRLAPMVPRHEHHRRAMGWFDGLAAGGAAFRAVMGEYAVAAA